MLLSLLGTLQMSSPHPAHDDADHTNPRNSYSVTFSFSDGELSEQEKWIKVIFLTKTDVCCYCPDVCMKTMQGNAWIIWIIKEPRLCLNPLAGKSFCICWERTLGDDAVQISVCRTHSNKITRDKILVHRVIQNVYLKHIWVMLQSFKRSCI